MFINNDEIQLDVAIKNAALLSASETASFEMEDLGE